MNSFYFLFERDRRGSVIVELAMVAPLLTFMLFASVEVTQLARAYMAFGTATQTMADVIARETDANSAAVITDACNAGKLVMGTFPSSTLTASVASVTNSATTGTVGVDWQNTSCGGGGVTSPVALATSMVPNSGDSVIIVTSSYTFTPVVSVVLTPSFTFTATAFARPRGNVI